MSKRERVLSILALVALFCLVSSMSYEDEQKQQRFFCDQVKAGIVPNYNDTDCEVTDDG